MKHFLTIVISLLSVSIIHSQDMTVSGPDGLLTVTITVENGQPMYSVQYKNKIMLENSPLGLRIRN